MAATLKAVFQSVSSTVTMPALGPNLSNVAGSGYAQYTGVTAFELFSCHLVRPYFRPGGELFDDPVDSLNTLVFTAGFGVSDKNGNLLVPFDYGNPDLGNFSTGSAPRQDLLFSKFYQLPSSSPGAFRHSRGLDNSTVIALKNASGTTVAANGFGFLVYSGSGDQKPVHNSAPGEWQFSQTPTSEIVAECTSYQSTGTSYRIDYTKAWDGKSYHNPTATTIYNDDYSTIVCSGVVTYSYFVGYDGQVKEPNELFDVWKVELVTSRGQTLAERLLPPPMYGANPIAVFPASTITRNDYYRFIVSRAVHVTDRPMGVGADQDPASKLYAHYLVALTAGAVTTTAPVNVSNWIQDKWWITDLNVNLANRGVSHRHGTVEIKPNDTVNFAVFFHNNGISVDPAATDLRLAVRSSTNASAYYFWANPAVTTVSAGGDVYYAITVTASDEDLLTAQAASILAGTNSPQALLAEVQWTTTRGTFTSDTFNITVANEVVREPDV